MSDAKRFKNSNAFGTTKDGAVVTRYTLKSDSLTVQVIDLGATITSVTVPDKTGAVGEITLGFDDAKPYSDGTSPYFGCVAGRYANRIAKGVFCINGSRPQTLAKNNDGNSLHGGNVGFDKRMWTVESTTESSITLSLVSSDGDEGYPGELKVCVTYSLAPGSLHIDYEAETTATTVVNLTNHTYWNLTDGGSSSILDHTVSLEADFFTPVDATAIPTGEIRSVAGTAMDLRKPTRIGDGHVAADTHKGLGYDHNFCLSGGTDMRGFREVGRVSCAKSGRWMSVSTDQPGVQFYTGNFLGGEFAGRNGIRYAQHSGFCLETQRFPDSPNRPHFPSTTLRPGETYVHRTVHTFGTSS